MTTWVDNAWKYLGTKEFPGAPSNPLIAMFWKLAKLAGIKDDAVPWCSGFACAMMEMAGIVSPRSDSAKSWLAWGRALANPVNGCVVVIQRPGGYHVGFVLGVDSAGRLVVIGGNQGDSVSIVGFDRNRVVGYRWPQAIAVAQTLAVVAIAQASKSEA